jgi:hypothetical protein
MMGMGMGGGQVKADGSFELVSVTPGAYRVIVNSFDGGRPKVVGNAKVSVGNNNVEGLVITPSPMTSFKGIVLVEGDKTLVNVKNVRVQAISDFAMSPPVQVSEDGSFALADLSPEKYRIVVPQVPAAYLKAVMVGGQDIKDSGIDLSNGGGGAMEIILSTKVAKVDGSVEKEKQDDAAGTVIVAKVGANDELTVLNQSARVEENGRFTISNMAPGEYKLFAFEESDMATVSDPDFLKKFVGRSIHVKIGEGESKAVNLKQIRYAETNSAPA